MAITNRGDTLDKEVVTSNPQTGDDVVGKTVDALVTESQEIMGEKLESITRAKELYDKVMSGEEPTRADQLVSYLPVSLVNWWEILVQVPDAAIINTGYLPEFELIMNKFLEDTVRKGGFYDLMEDGFSGFQQLGLFGNYLILASTDILDKKKVKTKIKDGVFVNYQGGSVSNVFYNVRATAIRSNSINQQVTRCMVTTDINIYAAEEIYPGITDIAFPGDLPNTNQESNETDQSTDTQKSYDQDTSIQLGFFYDMPSETYSIRAGSNNAKYKTIQGKEFVKMFKIWWRGGEKVTPPIAMAGMYPRSKGIYSTSLVELFYRVARTEGLIDTSLVNNVHDSNYAPMLFNVDKAEAGALLRQIKRGKDEMKKGNRPVIIPSLNSESGVAGVGQSNVSSVRPEPLTNENDKLEVKFKKILRSMGIDPDILLSNPDLTLGQEDKNIRSTNRTIRKRLSKMLDFFEFVFSFAIDRIIKLGDIKDETIFGRDINIDAEGEDIPLPEFLGQDITVGFIVGLFKEAKENMRLKFDLSTGTVFDDTLEVSALEKELQLAIPGSSHELRLRSALSMAKGGKPLKRADLQGTPGAEPVAPTPTPQPLTV